MATPTELSEQGKCFQCYGASSAEVVKLALLDNISSGSGPVTPCANLEGPQADPTGIYTPTFIGQVYVTTGHVWQATGLTSADWTEICTDCVAGVINFQSAQFAIFQVLDDTADTEFHFPNLTSVGDGTGIGVFDTSSDNFAPTLTVIDAPLLTSVESSMNFLGCNVLVTLNVPLLATVGLGFNGDLQLDSCESLTSLPFPSLTSVSGSFFATALFSLTTISLPSLVTVGVDFTANNNALLVNVSLPALVTVAGNVSISDTAVAGSSLTTFSAPNWLPTNGTTIDLSKNKLNVASINHILARCVASGVTTCTIALNGGTNAAPAGQGIIDKAALIAAGNNVITN